MAGPNEAIVMTRVKGGEDQPLQRCQSITGLCGFRGVDPPKDSNHLVADADFSIGRGRRVEACRDKRKDYVDVRS